jgi:CRISPR/Cas system-associated exonuclease Cas4 (RecB family)
MSDQWIRVSEVGEYLYCRRAWWLRRMYGYRSVNSEQLQSGAVYHREHYDQVQSSERMLSMVRVALVVMGIATAVVLLWWVLQVA